MKCFMIHFFMVWTAVGGFDRKLPPEGAGLVRSLGDVSELTRFGWVEDLVVSSPLVHFGNGKELELLKSLKKVLVG